MRRYRQNRVTKSVTKKPQPPPSSALTLSVQARKSTLKHLKRIAPDRFAAASRRPRERTWKALPERVEETLKARWALRAGGEGVALI